MNIQEISSYLFKYMIPGVSTFGIDLALLWTFTESFDIHYLPAVAAAFFISTLLNFFAVRYWAFKKLERKIHESYLYFLIFASLGIVLTTALMWLLVGVFDFGTVFARVLTATVVGLWNFIMNYYINFKMHEGSIKSTSNI